MAYILLKKADFEDIYENVVSDENYETIASQLEGKPLTIGLIDLPYEFSMVASDDETPTLVVGVRINGKRAEMARVMVDFSDEGELLLNTISGEASNGTCEFLYQIYCIVLQFMALHEEFKNYDEDNMAPDDESLVIAVENGIAKGVIMKGKERPDVVSYNQEGGLTKYKDRPFGE